MHFVIIVASIEGQTRKITQHILTLLKTDNHSVQIIDATDDVEALNMADTDGVILCAPVHVGHFPKSIYRLLKQNIA